MTDCVSNFKQGGSQTGNLGSRQCGDVSLVIFMALYCVFTAGSELCVCFLLSNAAWLERPPKCTYRYLLYCPRAGCNLPSAPLTIANYLLSRLTPGYQIPEARVLCGGQQVSESECHSKILRHCLRLSQGCGLRLGWGSLWCQEASFQHIVGILQERESQRQMNPFLIGQ